MTTDFDESVRAGPSFGPGRFRYSLQSEAWTPDTQNIMRQLTVKVFFTAQNQEFSVSMSTLVDSSQQQ